MAWRQGKIKYGPIVNVLGGFQHPTVERGRKWKIVSSVFVYLIFVGIKLPIDCTKHKCIRSCKDVESLNNPLL